MKEGGMKRGREAEPGGHGGLQCVPPGSCGKTVESLKDSLLSEDCSRKDPGQTPHPALGGVGGK